MISFNMDIYTFMENDTNSDEYLIINIAGQTDISLFDAFGVTFSDGSAKGLIADENRSITLLSI